MDTEEYIRKSVYMNRGLDPDDITFSDIVLFALIAIFAIMAWSWL